MFELDNLLLLEVGKRFDWRLAPPISPIWPDNERISAALPGVGALVAFSCLRGVDGNGLS